MKKIVIDAGHGGHDSGALGPTFLKESNVTLDLALRLRHLAESAGIEVLMTRSDDQFVSLDERSRMANAWDEVDLFVSIHCNAASNPDATGYEVFTTKGVTASDRIATAIFNAIKGAFPRERGRADWQDGDPDREENFSVLRNTVCPVVLVETGFISHSMGEAMMRSPEWRTKMAEAILSGIVAGLAT